MKEVGLSTALGAIFSNPIFLEHKEPKTAAEMRKKAASQRSHSFLGYIWYLIRNPWAVLFSAFGMRRPGQEDAAGKKCLNLDQLGLPGVVEHDISLTRRDHAQGDNLSRQPDHSEDLVASSSDGGHTLSAEDLAALRRRRIEKQKEVNPGLVYGPLQHQIACAEISLILDVFGDGSKVRCDFARAFFQEERLPLQEGWKKRRWWSLNRTIGKVKQLTGIQV